MAPQVCDSASRRGFSEIDRYSSGKYHRRAAAHVVTVNSRLLDARFVAEAFAIFSKNERIASRKPSS
jgi:hypothetical protein